METPKGPYKDYSPFNKEAIWVSMLVWGSVSFMGLGAEYLRICEPRGLPRP